MVIAGEIVDNKYYKYDACDPHDFYLFTSLRSFSLLFLL